MDRGIFLT